MATLEQIIDDARKLSIEEQRRLRAALEMIELNGDAQSANQEVSADESRSTHPNIGVDEIRRRRLEWLKANREEYGGQYVALDGNQLIDVGPNYRVAREKALAAGKSNAFVTYLSKADEVAEMGGLV